MNERNNYFNDSRELRRRGITEVTFNSRSNTIDLPGISTQTIILVEASTPMYGLR